FEAKRDADRPAEPRHRQRPLTVKTPPIAEQVEAAELGPRRDDDDERNTQDQPGQAAPKAAADQAQPRQAEMAEDQRPAEDSVENDAADTEPQHDARALERREEVPEQLEQQPRRGAPHVCAQEGLALS